MIPSHTIRRPRYRVLLLAVPILLVTTGGCSAQEAGTAPVAARPQDTDRHRGGGEDVGVLTPAGPLQANWRVTRPGDPSDAAIMLVQVIQDGAAIEGSYVLHQPFCGIDLPPVRAGAETCEFDGVSADISGQVADGWATLAFAPGADGLNHHLVFRALPAQGPLTGAYFAPGETVGVPVILGRAPE